MTEVENVQPSDDGSKGQAAKASPAEKRWQATQAGRARKTEYLKNKSVVLEKEKEI